MYSIAAHLLTLLLTQTGYLPYSNVTAMSFTSPVYTGSGSLISESNYSITATISDMDEYQRSIPPNDFKLFGNPNIDITRTINSGSVISVSSSFDSALGKGTIVWSCKAIYVAPNQTVTKIDTFEYKDTGSGIVWDGTIPYQYVTVTIKGPNSGGGG